MKHFSRIAVAAVLLISANTQAQEQEQEQLSGFSVISEIGYAEQEVDVSGGYGDESGSKVSPSIALSYNFNDNVSIVAQYTSYGEAKIFDEYDSGADIGGYSKTTGYSLVGQYMSNKHVGGWSFGGKLGVMFWDMDLIADLTYAGQSQRVTIGSDNGEAIYGGLITEYHISNNLSLLLNADFFVSETDIEIVSGEQTELFAARYSLGLKYQF